MTDLATPLLEVDKIEVVEGFNPRTHMDPDALARLAGSLGKTDVVQPLTVRPIEGGKFAVIAGHRRLEAAKMAGIEKVPVHVRESGDALTAALVGEPPPRGPRPDRHRPRPAGAGRGARI